VRARRFGLCRLEDEAAWIERYRHLWDARFDELDTVVEELKRRVKVGRTPASSGRTTKVAKAGPSPR
jgi:hypothetical protein